MDHYIVSIKSIKSNEPLMFTAGIVQGVIVVTTVNLNKFNADDKVKCYTPDEFDNLFDIRCAITPMGWLPMDGYNHLFKRHYPQETVQALAALKRKI